MRRPLRISVALTAVACLLVLPLPAQPVDPPAQPTEREKLRSEWSAKHLEYWQKINDAAASGRREQAVGVAEKLLELELDLLGQGHELVADSTIRTADLYWGGRQFEGAAKHYAAAADRLAGLYGADYQRVAVARAYARESAACAKLKGEQLTRFGTAESLLAEAHALRRRLDDATAADKYAVAHAAYSALLGERSIHTLAALLGEGASRQSSKRGLAAAEDVLTRALKSSKDVYGEQHPFTAAIHFDLGNLASEGGEPKRAVEHFVKAVDIRRRVAGQKGPDWGNTSELARVTARLAVCYRARREYASAEKYCQEAADVFAGIYGDKHWLVADARAFARHDAACAKLTREQLDRLATADQVYADAQDLARTPVGWKRAGEKYAAARTTYTDLFGESCIPVQNALFGEGAVLTDSTADPVKAAEVLERALAVSEEVFGPVHNTGANARNSLGILAVNRGDYKQAETHFKKAIELRHALWQWRLVPTAVTLANLGTLYTRLGDYARALPLLNDAYQILRENSAGLYDRKAVGLYTEQTAWAAQSIGRFRTQMGDYNAADEMYQLASSIRGEATADTHPAGVDLWADQGELAVAVGDSAAAVRHYTSALKLAETVYGADGVTTARVLNNLGRVYDLAGQADPAEKAYTRALDIQKAKLGAKHPDTLATLVNLGSLHLYAGRLRQAEPLLTDGLKLTTEVLGERHPGYAAALFELAVLHLRKGEFEQAERRGDEARAARERIYGKDHWVIAYDLQFRGTREAATGHPREALASFRAAMELEDKHLRAVFGFASETAMRGTAESARVTLSKVLSLAAGPLADDPAAAEFALQAVLRRKAAVLDTLCRQRELYSLLQKNTEVAQSAARVRQSYEKYQNALNDPPATGTSDDHARKVSDFRREYEEWDGRLHRVVERLRPTADAAATDTTTKSLREKLPADSALVEIVRTERYDFGKVAAADYRSPPRYFAFVLTADAKSPPRLIDLGAAEQLDGRIRAYRTSLARTARELRVASEKQVEAELNEQAGELAAAVFAPLAKHLRGVKKVYLAPDGEFHILPFEALTDADGRYLIESYQFKYLSSGRDLLRVAGKPASGVRVFAGPDFDWHPQLAKTPPAAGPEASPTATSSAPGLVRGMPLRSVRGLTWRPLPGAEREAADVKELLGGGTFGGVQVFTGGQARKSTFLGQTPPRVLHIATHGFYLPEKPDDDEPRITNVRSEHPAGELGLPSLRRSGVLLAGANRTAIGRSLPPTDDGWLTAEEIALMSLRGTELVVLSACETGLGDVQAGEGVYGLRRAFLYAGAQSLVVSLFKVPDAETRELMRGFYQRLNSDKGRLTALHDAKREAIDRRRAAGGAAHPFYWASFILVGSAH